MNFEHDLHMERSFTGKDAPRIDREVEAVQHYIYRQRYIGDPITNEKYRQIIETISGHVREPLVKFEDRYEDQKQMTRWIQKRWSQATTNIIGRKYKNGN